MMVRKLLRDGQGSTLTFETWWPCRATRIWNVVALIKFQVALKLQYTDVCIGNECNKVS